MKASALDARAASSISSSVTSPRWISPKRMFSATGHEVLTLHRVSFGPLTLDPALAEGQWRELRSEELGLLKAAAGMETERAAEDS